MKAKTDNGANDGSWNTFRLGLAWVAITWFAFAPLGIWPLGWLSTIPLTFLVWRGNLEGRNPYRWLWIAGLVYWLITFYFIPIPHPLLWGGWLAVSIYLAFYTPLLVCCARVMHHRFRIPVPIAMAIGVTGWEYVRGIAFTGMSMVCLSHSQFKLPWLIQVADLSGAYTLTFAMALTGSSIALVWLTQNSKRWSYLAAAIAVPALVAGYGFWRLGQPAAINEGGASFNVTLIQGSIDTTFPSSLEEYRRIEEERWNHYRDLTLEARQRHPDSNLIVWPESQFIANDYLPDYEFEDWPEEDIQKALHAPVGYWSEATGYPRQFDTAVPMIVGTSCFGDSRVYNSALLVDQNGFHRQKYFKNHLVMFGEFVPGRNLFPQLQEMTPIGRGCTVGDGPTIIEVNGMYVAPNICFESTVPHLMRRYFNELADDGRKPDVLLNVTNDGWFYGTSCLDFHLACNVFRAVELQTPVFVCANTGFSADISEQGVLRQVGPRRDTGIIHISQPQLENRTSLYRTIGDVLPGSLAILSGLSALIGVLPIRFTAKASPPGEVG